MGLPARLLCEVVLNYLAVVAFDELELRSGVPDSVGAVTPFFVCKEDGNAVYRMRATLEGTHEVLCWWSTFPDFLGVDAPQPIRLGTATVASRRRK